MNNTFNSIPLYVDIDKILQVLATQIYQSPLALIRENTQNAFDAILMRLSKADSFSPRIDVQLTDKMVVIIDNGIGMSQNDLKEHFWKAGSSSKNTESAKNAGVVGTFGIGAMANFGIAKELVVESESIETGERTISKARRENLSATRDCIEIETIPSKGVPGTIISAHLQDDHSLNINEAIRYLKNYVQHLTVPVYANDDLVSQVAISDSIQRGPGAYIFESEHVTIGNKTSAGIYMQIEKTGEVYVSLNNLVFMQNAFAGEMILRQGAGRINTCRSGFALAPTSISSTYAFGGVANFMFLKPTAGREALESDSVQVLQNIITEIDAFVSLKIAESELADKNTHFMTWVIQHNRYELLAKLSATILPNDIKIQLGELAERYPSLEYYYEGNDDSFARQHASEDSRLLVISKSRPRRKCELQYIQRYLSHLTKMDDSPHPELISEKQYSIAQSGLVFRLTNVLEKDYFIKANVMMANISHNIPVLVDRANEKPHIYIDPNGSTVSALLQLYSSEYHAFASLVKDFIRSMIFPKISDLVPSATKQGAEAFLKRIRSKKETFEYEYEDMGSLSEIWAKVASGEITIDEGAKRSQKVARKTIQEIDPSNARRASEVLHDVGSIVNQKQPSIEEEEAGEPLPAINRNDVFTDAKLLIVEDNESPINGFKCFIAVSDRIREDKGDFFLQPHTTSIVWGGQRALYVFQHHSGRFGLYYDLQSSDIFSEESGGGAIITSTIVLKNKIFIPVPDDLIGKFIPQQNEKKRFEVNADILYIDKDLEASIE